MNLRDAIAAAVEGVFDAGHDVEDKLSTKTSYPDDHKAAMRVPKGGSSCLSCKYVSQDKKQCSNKYFIAYNGSKDLPLPADEFCSDWYEPKTKIAAAEEVSLEGQQKGTLWNGIKIIGFTGPEEEGLRAMLSRIPPELFFNVKEIKSAKELNAKHGKYDPATHTISFNPANFNLRQRFGKGDGWIFHPELTAIHEVGHSIYHSFTPAQIKEWQDISGWMIGWKLGQSLAYQEKRPGWGDAKSDWTHKAGIKFTRHYGERNPGEDFADCFAFVILGKGHQMEPAKKQFIDSYMDKTVKSYQHVNIESPSSPYSPVTNKDDKNLYNITSGSTVDKHKLALDSYVPQTKKKSQAAIAADNLVAKYTGGTVLGDGGPFDVIKGKTGIEVKALFKTAHNDKVTMHPASLIRKIKAKKKLGLTKVYTVAVDVRQKPLVVYVKEGLGSFRLGGMQKLNSVNELGTYIK